MIVAVEDFGFFCRLVEFPAEGLVHITALGRRLLLPRSRDPHPDRPAGGHALPAGRPGRGDRGPGRHRPPRARPHPRHAPLEGGGRAGRSPRRTRERPSRPESLAPRLRPKTDPSPSKPKPKAQGRPTRFADFSRSVLSVRTGSREALGSPGLGQADHQVPPLGRRALDPEPSTAIRRRCPRNWSGWFWLG